MVVSYNSASHNNVRLNYVRLHFKRTLQPYGAYTFFRSIASIGNVSRFVVQGASANTLVFDVTDAQRVRLMETELNGSNLLSLFLPVPYGSSFWYGRIRALSLRRLSVRWRIKTYMPWSKKT